MLGVSNEHKDIFLFSDLKLASYKIVDVEQQARDNFWLDNLEQADF